MNSQEPIQPFMELSRRIFLTQIFSGSVCFLWNGLRLPTVSQFDQGKLEVGGLATNPQDFGIADLQALAGTPRFSMPLSLILKQVKPLKRARYVVLDWPDQRFCIDIVTAYAGETMLVCDGKRLNVKRIELRDKTFGSIVA